MRQLPQPRQGQLRGVGAEQDQPAGPIRIGPERDARPLDRAPHLLGRVEDSEQFERSQAERHGSGHQVQIE